MFVEQFIRLLFFCPLNLYSLNLMSFKQYFCSLKLGKQNSLELSLIKSLRSGWQTPSHTKISKHTGALLNVDQVLAPEFS